MVKNLCFSFQLSDSQIVSPDSKFVLSDDVITNVSGAIDEKYRQIVFKSVLVHKPALLG